MASQAQHVEPKQLLAIAKTSFVATLMRRDPDPVSREEIDRFHTYLNAALEQCTTENIQICKIWLVKNASHSPARVSSLGKYLAAQSAAFPSLQAQAKGGDEGKTSPKAKRLFVIFLISDLFHHDGTDKGQGVLQTVAVNIKSYLKPLFAAASDLHVEKNKSIIRQLHLVLDCWKEQQYFSDKILDKLRTIVESGGKADVEMSDDNAEEVVPSISKPKPHALPAMHGEDLSPWFHQPAGAILHEVGSDPERLVDLKLMKPLKLKAGPAPDTLANAVRDFMDDVANIGTAEDMDDENPIGLDGLGQLAITDSEISDLDKSKAYYGWTEDTTRTIIQSRGENDPTDSVVRAVKYWYIPRGSSRSRNPSPLPADRRSSLVKERHSDNSQMDSTRGRRVSSYRSKSPDASRSPYGRDRRYSRSTSPPRQRRSGSGSSRGRSSSRRRPRYPSRSRSRSRSYTASRSRSRSRSPFRNSRSRGREERFSPDRSEERRYNQYQPVASFEDYQQQRQPPPGMGAAPPPPPPIGMPMPPFRPPNWQGPWPPPPPPPNMIPGQVPFPPFAGGPIPPQIFGGGPVPPNFPPMPPNIAPPIPPQWSQPYPPPPNYEHPGGQNFRGGRGGGHRGYGGR